MTRHDRIAGSTQRHRDAREQEDSPRSSGGPQSTDPPAPAAQAQTASAKPQQTPSRPSAVPMLSQPADAGYSSYSPLPTGPSRESGAGEDDGQSDVGEDDTDSAPSCFSFVEHGAFGGLTAVIIVANIVGIAAEAQDPAWKPGMFWPNQCMLCFYIFELSCRVGLLRWDFFFGSWDLVAWDVLDCVVVLAAVADQWLLPLLPGKPGPDMVRILTMLRLLRLLRIVKILRIFLETDLSWAEAPAFETFIGLVIVFNAAIFGAETDYKWSGWYYIEQILLVIYAFELSIRMKRAGRKFLSCTNDDITWNVLDSVIVWSSVAEQWVEPILLILLSLVEGSDAHDSTSHGGKSSLGSMMTLMRLLRLMRILRLVKLVKFVTPLYILVVGVMNAVQGVFWVLMLTLAVIYAAGIVACRLIAHGLVYPDPDLIPVEVLDAFGTVPESMFTLFRVMCGVASTEESLAVDMVMSSAPCAKFALVFFMITASWTLLSILTSVVSEEMLHSTDFFFGEEKVTESIAQRKQHRRLIEQLFEDLDSDHCGTITDRKLQKFFEDSNNASRAAKITKILPQDVHDILEYKIKHHGRGVEKEEFVSSLIGVSEMLTEKSLMCIEGRLSLESRGILDGLEGLNARLEALQGEVAKDKKEREELRTTLGLLLEIQRAQGAALERERSEVAASSLSTTPEQRLLEPKGDRAVRRRPSWHPRTATS